MHFPPFVSNAWRNPNILGEIFGRTYKPDPCHLYSGVLKYRNYFASEWTYLVESFAKEHVGLLF